MSELLLIPVLVLATIFLILGITTEVLDILDRLGRIRAAQHAIGERLIEEANLMVVGDEARTALQVIGNALSEKGDYVVDDVRAMVAEIIASHPRA